jgi:hypothetical protein
MDGRTPSRTLSGLGPGPHAAVPISPRSELELDLRLNLESIVVGERACMPAVCRRSKFESQAENVWTVPNQRRKPGMSVELLKCSTRRQGILGIYRHRCEFAGCKNPPPPVNGKIFPHHACPKLNFSVEPAEMLRSLSLSSAAPNTIAVCRSLSKQRRNPVPLNGSRIPA